MSDLVTTRIFTDGEKGITAAKLNDIVASSTIQTDFVATKPATSTVDPADNLLVLKSSGQYAKAPFQTIVDSVNTQLPSNDAEIWSVRLRSFNAVGNPNFEVAQRNVGNVLSNPAHGTSIEDRWVAFNNGSLNPAFQRTASGLGPGTGVILPGTNFTLSSYWMRITCQTVKSTLAATDLLGINQTVEGPMLRELLNDVHSVSLLVRSSVANLTFGLNLRDPTSTAHSLTKLCTLGPANTLTLITLPNLPAWVSSGTFTTAIGSPGYLLGICLAAGATYRSPANDTWQNGNFMGASGQSNFLSNPVNSTFEVMMVQHEPGPVCSTLIDKPFSQNLDECLRYFTKSYNYAAKPGTTGTSGVNFFVPAGGINPVFYIPFKKTMANVPTVVCYSPPTGAVNVVRDQTASAERAATVYRPTDNGFNGATVTGGASTIWQASLEYTADTGW